MRKIPQGWMFKTIPKGWMFKKNSRGLEVQEAEMSSKRAYMEEEKSADFRKKKVTDCKLKKRITVPGPVDENKEGKILSLVNILENIVDKEAGKRKETSLRAGRPTVVSSTLSLQQKEGRKSLMAREKSGELVIVGSDKSGKRAAMSRQIYIDLMEPHIRGDQSYTREEVNTQEKQFNGAATHLLRCFNYGQNWGHEDRFRSAFKANYNQVPSLNQLVKDHKATLKTRPVARAQAAQAPNGPLGDLVGEILTPFIEAADSKDRTEVISTEELLHKVEEVNKRISKNGMKGGIFQRAGSSVVGSMDVDSFYPNIDIDVAAEEAKLEVIESEVTVEGVDTDEVALFLACSMTQEEIDLEGLTNVVPKRRCNKGPRPGLTSKAITGGMVVRGKAQNESWLPASRKPGVRQKRRMVGCLVKVAVKLVMKEHFYSFNNVIRKQSKGGAI